MDAPFRVSVAPKVWRLESLVCSLAHYYLGFCSAVQLEVEDLLDDIAMPCGIRDLNFHFHTRLDQPAFVLTLDVATIRHGLALELELHVAIATDALWVIDRSDDSANLTKIPDRFLIVTCG